MSYTADPRVLFAAERTLLAWQRTAIALMGFGFVVERFGLPSPWPCTFYLRRKARVNSGVLRRTAAASHADEHMHVDAHTLAKRVFPNSSGARPLLRANTRLNCRQAKSTSPMIPRQNSSPAAYPTQPASRAAKA